MGLAAPGEGYRVVRDGIAEKTGKLPINVSGGLKSKGHLIGATGTSMHVMACLQLMNEGGDMQIKAQARWRLQHGRRGRRQLRFDPGAPQMTTPGIAPAESVAPVSKRVMNLSISCVRRRGATATRSASCG